MKLVTLLRLVGADLEKLSRYWVILAGYLAMLAFAVLGAIGVHAVEEVLDVRSSSGWGFALSMMLRYLDFGGLILYVMICLLFAIEITHSTIKCILTRSITRMELVVSKYLTAMVMIVVTLVIFWCVALGAGWYYYGLGDLTENEYVIFEASYLLGKILVGSLFLLLPLAALASMALLISIHSSTMGGAIVVGLISFFFLQTLSMVPANLGFTVAWGDEVRLVSWGTFGIPSQLFVPMYVLDDLPTGIHIHSWWSWSVQKMTFVCAAFFLLCFAGSAVGLQRRDFTL